MKLTKRNVLKILSPFYDSVGLIQPIIIGLDILMQNICKETLDWDDMLSQKLLEDWHDCLTKLEKMGSIETLSFWNRE